MRKVHNVKKKPFIAHFIEYYSGNILDSVISQPHIEITGFLLLMRLQE